MANFYRSLLLFTFITGAFFESAAQRPMTFDHLTVEEGLSQSLVYAITRDAEGYMWFGTRDGLNRYDSRTIKIYRNKDSDPHSLSGNNIHCFLTDGNKRLWIGTNEGLSIYNTRQDNFIVSVNDPADKQSLANNHISGIVEDEDGTIWVGTFGGLHKVISTAPLRYERLCRVDKDPTSLLHNEVRAVYIDRKGSLWVGTPKGICRLIKEADGGYSFENYPFSVQTQFLKGINWVNTLSEDNQGNILIGTEKDGIKQLNAASRTYSSFNLHAPIDRPLESVRTIERMDNGELWIGAIEGLYIYDETARKATILRNNPEDNTSLNDNSVRSIYKDKNGTCWIGTFYGGVSYYSPMSRQFGQVILTNHKNQKAFKIAGALVTDKHGNLWVSTDGNGLYCINSEGETIKQFRHDPHDPHSLSHNKVKCLYLEEKGLWVGTLDGLNYYDFRTGKFTRYFHDPADVTSMADDRIYDIRKDDAHHLWIATYRGGLCRLDKRTNTFERFVHNDARPHSLSSNGATYLHRDSENNLWVGTVTGLNKKRTGQNFFEQYGNNSENYVLCIYEDQRKNLWIGTRDTGLKLKKPGREDLVRFTVEDGLPGNTVSAIQEDAQGRLWLSTENGLSRLDPATLTFKNYNKSDGLVCKEFNFNSFHKDTDGILYFGGYNGIVKFHPDSIRENNTTPTLQLTRLRLFNKEVPIDPSGKGVLTQSLASTSSLTFTYLQNVFSVEFAALSYINGSKNQYAYKLEGFEEQWNYVNEPVATYMNLEPGDYTLSVKASNNDGIWTPAPLQLKITVLPPPWKTWWAYSIYCVIILALLYALIRFNKMRWKLTHDLEIEHMEKEQQEKLHHAKLNFFTNIAHEIRTPLTLIVSPLEMLLEKYAHDSLLQRQLRAVTSNTNRLMRLINQLLDFQKQEAGNLKLKRRTGNLVELLKEIVFSFTEYAHSRHIRLKFLARQEDMQVNFDRDELEKVFCNLLHNAFKFTPGGGEITITVDTETPEIDNVLTPFARIIIEDNGIGIPSEDLPKIFNRFFQAEHSNINESGFGIGLALAKGIINLHGGSINVESHEAELGQSGYTRFSILLPIHTVTAEPAPEAGPAVEKEILLPVVNNEPAHSAHNGHHQKHNRPLILLVEDNVEIRNCLKTVLGADYQILEASNGREALETATQQLPDLIVSDIAMPEMDGLEFTRRIKQDDRTDHIPVVLLTARGAMEHHIEGIETGADDYITKPFHASILRLKIRNLLAMRSKLREKYHRVVTLEPQHEEIEDPENKFLVRLMGILDANLVDPDFNVARLVTEIGMSRPVLFRKVKMLTGLSVIDLIRSTRLKKAEMLLKQRKMTISEVAFNVGFNDPKYFSKSFRSQFGKTPTEYMDSL